MMIQDHLIELLSGFCRIFVLLGLMQLCLFDRSLGLRKNECLKGIYGFNCNLGLLLIKPLNGTFDGRLPITSMFILCVLRRFVVCCKEERVNRTRLVV